MTKHQLHRKSHGVVHRTPNRIRLRVPKQYRQRETLHPVKVAITGVQGVHSVEMNPDTGSILVTHDERPGILAAIGAAIEECTPELLGALVAPETLEESGATLLAGIFKHYLAEPRTGNLAKRSAGSPRASVDETMPEVSVSSVKRIVPAAFLIAGAYKLISTESLWAGVAPLVLFYYAFDTYWKFSQEQKEISRIEAEVEAH